ncbi:MAG TPA: M48 family metalloprotease [Hydrogenophaga sp.]|uniref:M48 family metalloprotease n=1 Tax=Hydrogenophaga sp. TaxID=1904254 RepID=UPI002CE3C8FA|nr:M48 family metalloprotease [Hydrogenophaga sp.]HMN91981.1 M48 family metalloprotease [Hydrogenophaga sp.]HMP08783.1 M48 family metalloprotease [Hydrogenophaga sp.]
MRMTVHWAARLGRPRLVFLAAALALSLGPLSAQPVPAASSLPSLGDVDGMTLADERRLGDRIARDIYRDPDYLDDPLLGDYLQRLWQPLLAAARSRGEISPELAERMAWELMISRDRRVNAFALPGGYFGVHLGLIGVTDNSAELASVLAHELAHVSQRHIARMLSRQDRMAPWVLGAMILGALAARSNVDAANAAIVGSQAVAAQTQLNFSRDMEREADRIGFTVLTGAGFEGEGFVSMFEKLQQASRLNDDGAFPYLRSHPLTSERMADMRARLPQGGPGGASGPLVSRDPAAPSPVNQGILNLSLPSDGKLPAAVLPPAGLHALMAARARVLAENGPDRLRAWMASGQGAQARPGDRYAAAWSAHRLGQPEVAERLARQLRNEVDADVAWVADALWMEVVMAPGLQRTAAQQAELARLRDLKLAAGDRASLLLGAQAAMATGEPRPAASRLQTWVVNRPGDALAWQSLGAVYRLQGQTLRAVRADAEAHVAMRDYAGAQERLRAAQSLPAAQRAADPVEMAVVDARLRDVQALLRQAEQAERDSR